MANIKRSGSLASYPFVYNNYKTFLLKLFINAFWYDTEMKYTFVIFYSILNQKKTQPVKTYDASIYRYYEWNYGLKSKLQ